MGRARWLAALLILLSTAATLLGVEIALRVWHGDLFTVPYPGGSVRAIGSYPGTYDAELGFVPEPGASADHLWNLPVTITAAGVRSNGVAPPTHGVPTLAVGDSFTFGDEVADRDTWPAQLEARLGRPVVNGGVFGYGLDQTVLRSERLMRVSGADTLIVSFTADDVRRCEFEYRYAWKPWFEVEAGALSLRGVPVPSPDSAPPGESFMRRALRRSFLADLIMRRIDADGWALPDTIRIHRQGVRVARLLVDRLADSAERDGHRLLIVMQWHPKAERAYANPVLQRARERRLEVVSLERALRGEIAAHPQGVEGLFHLRQVAGRAAEVGHMTAFGNGIVARELAGHL